MFTSRDRKHFDDEQLAQESGGRQFDKGGKPLVGKYRDGTMPSPSKRAYGAGQMQVGTAREQAQRSGIPWDEKKFFNDREYNLTLADEHMSYLETKYGDKKLAKAAYHSGVGTVDSAIAKYGRDGFEQGLGPEGKAYVGGGKAGSGFAAKPYEAPKMTQGEERSMAGEDRLKISDPFAAGTSESLASGIDEIGDRTNQLDTMLSDAVGQIHQNNQDKMASLVQTNEAKQGVLEEMRGQNQALIERARPLFQTREAIAARTRELAEMNPGERLIKGLFNPNYNGTDLRARDKAARNELEVLGENNDYVSKLQQGIVNIMAAEHGDQAAFFDLYNSSLDKDIQLVNQSVAVSGAKFDNAMRGLETQTSVLRAQALARQDTLSQLSEAQVGSALEQAKTDPNGRAVVNGVPLGVGELTALQNNYRDQQMALESRQLALESNKLQLADQYEDKAVENMSPAEIDAAINNGGVHKGQQLNMQKLAQAKQALLVIKNQQLNDVETNSAFGQSKMLTRVIKDTMIGTSKRMGAMMGSVPESQRNLMESTAAELQIISKGIEEAEAKGVSTEYYAGQVAKKQALLKRQEEVIDQVATQWAGTSKDMKAVGVAWLKGQPMTNETAINGLISMARNGKPAGMKMDGVTAQVFKVVEAVVRKADSPQPGQTPQDMFASDPQNQAEKKRKLIQDVRVAVEGAYNDTTVDAILGQAPEMASQIRVNGRVHPFARIRTEDFRMALAYGTQEAYKRNGLNPGDAVPPNLLSKVQGDETIAMLEALDARASEPGFTPSRAYADLLGNSQFRGMVGSATQNAMKSGFGAYVTGSAAGGDFNTQFDAYSRNVQRGYTAMTAAQTNQRILQKRSLLADPWDRSSSVMRLAGLSAQESDRLVKAVRPEATRRAGQSGQVSQPGMLGSLMGGPNDDQLVARHDVFESIQETILNTKFDHPELEALRKRAAKGWAESRQQLDKSVEAMTRQNVGNM